MGQTTRICAFDKSDLVLVRRHHATLVIMRWPIIRVVQENILKTYENRAIIISVSQEEVNMKLHLPSKKFIVSSFSLIVAIAVLLTVVPTVYAEDEGPLTPIPGLGRVPNVTLVRMHKQEIGWYTDQETMFRQANTLAATFADLIAAQASGGKDVSGLQTGLDSFKAEVAASREIHLVAGTAIFNLIAFKESGNVGDRLAAGQSLLDGRTSLKEANFRLTRAMAVLRKAFDKWRHDRMRNWVPAYKYP
jgi:hypothetical protein